MRPCGRGRKFGSGRRIHACDPVFRFCITQIEDEEKEIFQGLHQKIDDIRRVRRTDVPCDREAVGIVKMPDAAVQAGEAFFQKLFKRVGNAQLAVDDDYMTMADAHTQRLYQFSMPSGGNGAQIMLIIVEVGGRNLLGQIPS